MKRWLPALGIGLLPILGFSQDGKFDHIEWTNADGQGFEACLEHVEGDKVILRAKRGGKRYPVKIETLSEKSKQQLEAYKEEVRTGLRKGGTRGGLGPVALVYRAVALEIDDELLPKLKKDVAFTVSKIRVKDRLTAILVFEGGCFKKIPAPPDLEFFIKDKTLNTRSSAKGRYTPYYWYYRGGDVDRDRRVLLREGGVFQLYLGPETIVEWGRIGVSEGPVFQ